MLLIWNKVTETKYGAEVNGYTYVVERTPGKRFNVFAWKTGSEGEIEKLNSGATSQTECKRIAQEAADSVSGECDVCGEKINPLAYIDHLHCQTSEDEKIEAVVETMNLESDAEYREFHAETSDERPCAELTETVSEVEDGDELGEEVVLKMFSEEPATVDVGKPSPADVVEVPVSFGTRTETLFVERKPPYRVKLGNGGEWFRVGDFFALVGKGVARTVRKALREYGVAGAAARSQECLLGRVA